MSARGQIRPGSKRRNDVNRPSRRLVPVLIVLLDRRAKPIYLAPTIAQLCLKCMPLRLLARPISSLYGSGRYGALKIRKLVSKLLNLAPVVGKPVVQLCSDTEPHEPNPSDQRGRGGKRPAKREDEHQAGDDKSENKKDDRL